MGNNYSNILTPVIRSPFELGRELLQAKVKGEGFLNVRFGDGEGAVLNSNGLVSEEFLNRMTKVWFDGRKPEDTVVDYLADQLRKILEKPSPFKFIGIPGSKGSNLDTPQNIANASVLSEVLKSSSFMGMSYCSNMIHRGLQKNGLLGSLINKFDKVVIVTCHDNLLNEISTVFKEVSFEAIMIPGETWHGCYVDHVVDRHQLFSEIISNIEPQKDTLYLIGAGVYGKILANFIFENGGIALDVGSVLDMWAKRSARSHLVNSLSESDTLEFYQLRKKRIQHAIKTSKNDIDHGIWQSRLYLLDLELDSALNYASMTFCNNTESVKSAFNYAQMLRLCGQVSKALVMYRFCNELDPDSLLKIEKNEINNVLNRGGLLNV